MPSITAPIIAAGIGAVGSVAGGLLSSSAAKSAAKAQQNAAQIAANTQLQIYHETTGNLAPYNKAGQSAIGQLAALFGIGTGGPTTGTAANAMNALTQYPGYQFQFNQGLQALDRSAASRGLLLSGAQLKDSQAYGQGFAQNAWGNYLSQLYQLGSLGENAAAMAGNIGATTGANVANAQLAAGQAQAAGIVGSNNALLGGLQGGLTNSLLAYQLYANQPYSGGSVNITPQQTDPYGFNPADFGAIE